jgi:hypothetical protein
MFYGSINGLELDGYVPNDLNIGGGDYIEFDVCLDCGQMQGQYPLPESQHEKDISDEEIVQFFDNHFVEGKSADVPAFRHREILNSAGYLSDRFRKFVSSYLSQDSTMRERQHGVVHPSVNTFITMYRNNDPYIEG